MSFKKVGWDFTPLILFFWICVWHMIDDIRCLFSFFSLKISFARFFLQICVFSWSITCGILLSLFICRFLFDALKFPSAQAEMVFACRISCCFFRSVCGFFGSRCREFRWGVVLRSFFCRLFRRLSCRVYTPEGAAGSINMYVGFWFKLVFSMLFLFNLLHIVNFL